MDNHNQHSGLNQSVGMRKYKAVTALKNLNTLADRIEINYNNLDTVTAGDLKQTISQTLHNFTELEVNEDKMKYIRSLIKQNMTYKIDIDYAKLDEDTEDLLLAYTLKTEIQKVLTARKGILYRDLILNANY